MPTQTPFRERYRRYFCRLGSWFRFYVAWKR